jgi:hypothetical protein
MASAMYELNRGRLLGLVILCLLLIVEMRRPDEWGKKHEIA